ncbi:hypothetical protein F7725_001340 [Dissostichus mawsoni]|uniref:Rad21/Rec8-like protein N-terminal domain-containing protein n=1 Tax=Dissostichus mawsoni TaxID=36200 RepID=A0A7J5ZH18_DISMA|nr:hypothetical protein F7725_001340 [Dissostichus mawsoni]
MIFYTQLFTSKRGPLSKIWLAAHWERKLTKAQMKIGLRTSGHLLVGVVRIYSKKAKYLLADSTDALFKIKFAFRPGQRDLPDEELEATLKAITLNEDFPDFDTQLPHPRFPLPGETSPRASALGCWTSRASLNRETVLGTRTEEETSWVMIVNRSGYFLTNSENPESPDLIPEILRMKIHTSQHSGINKVVTPTQDETTLLANEEEGFALDPVARRGKRKRRLVVDQSKELSSESIREQISNCSDLIASLDMAPPTRQLMQWKESGRADKLLAQLCSTLFAKTIFQVKPSGVHQEVEGMREDGGDAQRDITMDVTVVDSSIDQETTHNTDVSDLGHMTDNQGENNFDLRESLLESQDLEERKLIKRTQNLLHALKVRIHFRY